MTNTIKLRGIVMEDFTNYKVPSLFLISTTCDFKCCHEGGFAESVCQNEPLIKDSIIKEYKIESIFNAYINNPITKSIVIGGLEPMLQFDEVKSLIDYFRWHECFDDIIIYTGYYPNEIVNYLTSLQKYANIIVKFGRFQINNQPHFDEVLGINLASDNQYAERIS